MMISLILLYLLVIVFQVIADTTDNDSVHHRHYLRGSERGN